VVEKLVEVPCYKLEGRGFDSHIGEFCSACGPGFHTTPNKQKCVPGIFSLSGVKMRQAGKADNPSAVFEPIA
jgi:hypothetical protein